MKTLDANESFKFLVDAGGPAYPTVFRGENGEDLVLSGMSLRDWFAGQALNALIEDVNRPMSGGIDAAEHPRESIARRAYAIADAMLEARKR